MQLLPSGCKQINIALHSMFRFLTEKLFMLWCEAKRRLLTEELYAASISFVKTARTALLSEAASPAWLPLEGDFCFHGIHLLMSFEVQSFSVQVHQWHINKSKVHPEDPRPRRSHL